MGFFVVFFFKGNHLGCSTWNLYTLHLSINWHFPPQDFTRNTFNLEPDSLQCNMRDTLLECEWTQSDWTRSILDCGADTHTPQGCLRHESVLSSRMLRREAICLSTRLPVTWIHTHPTRLPLTRTYTSPPIPVTRSHIPSLQGCCDGDLYGPTWQGLFSSLDLCFFKPTLLLS